METCPSSVLIYVNKVCLLIIYVDIACARVFSLIRYEPKASEHAFLYYSSRFPKIVETISSLYIGNESTESTDITRFFESDKGYNTLLLAYMHLGIHLPGSPTPQPVTTPWTRSSTLEQNLRDLGEFWKGEHFRAYQGAAPGRND